MLFSCYRIFVSPLLQLLCGPQYGCRFIPTCSQYTEIALAKYGFLKGALLASYRICRCHPFSEGGLDEV